MSYLRFSILILNRSSFARRDMSESQMLRLHGFLRSAPELKLDSLPETIEGCLDGIGQIDQVEQRYLQKIAKLADKRRILLSKVQQMMQASPSSSGDLEGQFPFKPVEVTKNNATCLKALSSGNSGAYSSCEEVVCQRHPNNIQHFTGGKTERSDLLKWDKVGLLSTFCDDTVTSTLISTLKKLKWQHRDFQHIRRWCKVLTNLFYETDENGSGSIEEVEFQRMIDKLPIRDFEKEDLRCQFEEINLDGNGGISLAEFLFFFLQYKPFRVELNDNFYNEPYLGQQNLSCLQRTRLLIYKTITVTNFNTFSKVLYCVDLGFTLVPFVLLFSYALSPTIENRLHWDEDFYLWFVSIFFSVQWLLGLSLCSNKAAYLSSRYHIIELVSFLPWMIFKGASYTDKDVNVNGFVLFRVLRVYQFTYIFPSMFISLKKQIGIYVNTLILAFTSYRVMALFMLFINLFTSTLIFAFERGEYSEDKNIWIRPGESEESPFSNFFNCFYFTTVTGTTLGYGDMSPVTYVGKLIALITVVIGLINITLVINTIGDCFQEVFHRYLEERTVKLEDERVNFIRKNVDQAKRKIEHLYKKRTRRNFTSKASNDDEFLPV